MAAGSEDRAATDAGRTGDKIRVSDPAAAPMETDAETAGTPTPRRAVRASLRERLAIAAATPRPDTFGAWRQPNAEHQRRLGWLLLAWTLVLVLLGVVAGWIGFL